MTTRIQTLRFGVAGVRPEVGDYAPGTLWVNFADPSFGFINAAGAPVVVADLSSASPVVLRNPAAGAGQVIEAADPADVALTLKLAASQTANGLVVLDSEDNTLIAISPEGHMLLPGGGEGLQAITHDEVADLLAALPANPVVADPEAGNGQKISSAEGADIPLTLEGTADQTAPLLVFQNTEGLLAYVAADGNLTIPGGGTGSQAMTRDEILAYIDTLPGMDGFDEAAFIQAGPPEGVNQTIIPGGPEDVALTLQGAIGQTADLLHVRDEEGTLLAGIDASGAMTVPAGGAGAQAIQSDEVDTRIADAIAAIPSPETATGFTTGDVKMRFGPTEAGWLDMFGETIGNVGSGADHESADYEALFNMMKVMPFNVGTEDFASGDVVSLPDMRNRSPIGYTADKPGMANDIDIGEAAGAEEVTLTEAQMPVHSHTGSTGSSGGHSHGYSYVNAVKSGAADQTGGPVKGLANSTVGSSTNSAGSHSHSVSTNSKGGGEAHNNLGPVMGVRMVIKW